MTLTSEQTMGVLIERLNWPVRMVRWQAAREFARLLSSSQRATAIEAYLNWLRSRQFESEVVAGLAVLFCTRQAGLPSAADVKKNVKKPSILAELMFQRLYRQVLGGWLKQHSGMAPQSFHVDRYFEEHKGQVIPLNLANRFETLEQGHGPPFSRQWAYEWRRLMDITKSPYSGFPYHFVDAQNRSRVGGQFSVGQCHVYRSAYLRTLAIAVQQWGMPTDLAVQISTNCLPLNRGLESIQPIPRPRWLRDNPESCCKAGASLETFARRMTKANAGTKGMRPVSLRVPIKEAVEEYAELSIESCLVTPDFVPKPENAEEQFHRLEIWPLPDLISFEGQLPEADLEDYRSTGQTGSAVPLCLNVWPMPHGFWQGEYVHLGLSLPGCYNFSPARHVKCTNGLIVLSEGKRRVAHWRVWHDNWTPLYPVEEGHTRCGSVTEMDVLALKDTLSASGMGLGWQVQLKIWRKTSEYGELALTKRIAFFRDT